MGKDAEKKRRTAGRRRDKTEGSERAVSDTAAERYPMMEGLEGGRGRGARGSMGLVDWGFIYNAERPERAYLRRRLLLIVFPDEPAAAGAF